MTSLDDTPPATNVPEWSVSELAGALKRTVEDAYGHVRVRGEISQPKFAGSGHCYLRLKDADAVLDAVIWRGVAARLSVRPEEGMEVVATGRLTTYPGRSSYQLVIESLDLAGQGALLKLLEDRRRRLAAEGLFAPERKRPLPFLPRVIGVVTSPTGAVIRDILHRLADRFPMHVLVWPVLVQGEGAAAQVAAAVDGFNRLTPGGAPGGGAIPRPDLLIVARGGGSLEDLMAFNEEAVVRAVAASAIPVISAIGHETDVTLCDHAADRRAPTPTGAAEMAVPVRLDLLAQVRDDGQRLTAAAGRLLAERALRLEGLGRGLPDLARRVEDLAQRLDERGERLAAALAAGLERRAAAVRTLGARLRGPGEQIAAKDGALRLAAAGLAGAARAVVRERGQRLPQLGERLAALGPRLAERPAERLESLAARLAAASYESALKRGYAVVWDDAGHLVAGAAAARPGAAWTVEFHDGRTQVTVGGGGASGRKPRPSTHSKVDDRQESLF